VKIEVFYTTRLKHALGCSSNEVDVPSPLTVGQLLEHLSQLHGELFDKLVLTSQGELSSSILVCVGSSCLGRDLSAILHEGDDVTFLSPVSGG
jgi:molybdopterin converting factor small subunit